MSWRVIAAIMIALFAILTVSAVTADPIRQVTDTIAEVDDGQGGNYDTESQADSGIRAYENLILVLVFGLIGWGGWRVLRRELTEGRL